MSAELERLVAFLEDLTGKRLDEGRLVEILELANEQQEWSRRTRDLLAATSPAPLDIVDSIPAVMLPQWHRGTEWARDAARSFHEEVEGLVADGSAVCEDEQLRLMWIGRGLWFNLGFYQHFQREYGAVFVWSMYLAIAADGYLRYGGPPLRALSARFAAFSDLIGMPGLGRPLVRQGGSVASGRRGRAPRHARVAQQLLRHAGPRGGRHPGARDRREQRRRARLGRGGVRPVALASSSRRGYGHDRTRCCCSAT